jgi:hypothetical protein
VRGGSLTIRKGVDLCGGVSFARTYVTTHDLPFLEENSEDSELVSFAKISKYW